LLLLGIAVRHDRIAAIGDGAEHPHGELFELAAGLLEEDGEIDRRAAGAAIFLRHDQAEPALPASAS
jgi:hypothetical protein